MKIVIPGGSGQVGLGRWADAARNLVASRQT
jgi:hypothetical protein